MWTYLLFFIVISNAQNIRTLKLFKINNIQYQCNNPGCSSSTIVYVSNLIRCETACLTNTECRTVTFNSSNNRCELFVDIIEQYGNMIPQIGFITMTAIDNRRLFAPTTTTTATTTTTTTAAPTCANTCSSSGTYSSSASTTCGRFCETIPPGAFGTPTGSVGSNGTCYSTSTFCPGGIYTIHRNTYSTVNFDCESSYGCTGFGGCCTGIGNISAPNHYCISCSLN
ncbi:unnamed protein product [Adineta ricciae]|uniref:Apple domain-containing protein n=1 Tax=Adineta ricciae TaxID=249248 RepID=A0A814ZZ20_ADIRI|nr:unnamed protein product [Adineta ricciae]CAF1248848.1 unnamed protein product [Adineta ricciae]